MADFISMLAGAAGGGAEETDPDFKQTVLLLHGDGTNGAQNNTFLDSSTNNFTITRNGNTTQGTFSPFSLADGQWSNYFDGSGDSISFTGTAVGTDDITFEAWIYLTAGASATYYALIDARTSGNAATGFSVYAVGTGSAATIEVWGDGLKGSSASGAISLNTWTHVALLRTSGTCQVYVNGSTSGSSFTFNNNWTATARIVGTNSGGANFPFVGYMSNMRLVDGTAITPSTGGNSPLTNVSGTDFLIMQSNRFVDNSSNNRALTIAGNTSVQPFSPFAPTAAYSASVNGGSGYFDGSGDYLTAPDDAAFDFGTSAFTFECWYYKLANATQALVDTRSGPSNGYLIAPQSDGTLHVDDAVTGALLNGSIVFPTNAWTHIVVVKDGSNNLASFINGVRDDLDTATTTFNAATNFTIGAKSYVDSGAVPITGYLSGLRVIKGSAAYDPTQTTLTVPTAPPTAITNTQLLCNFTNAGIFDNTGKNNLETVGNAQIDTTTKKYGTGSMEFDGNGDYLKTNGPTELTTFGTGDFTIEMWVYVNSLPGTDMVLYDGRPSNGAYPCIILQGSTNKIIWYVSTSARITATNTAPTGTWFHLAISRSGTSTKMFVDGTQSGSTYTDSTNYLGSATRPYIGANATNGAESFNGFIDDLRITKGVARYTATFTPPTKAFPDL